MGEPAARGGEVSVSVTGAVEWTNPFVVTPQELMRELKVEEIENRIDALIARTATGTGDNVAIMAGVQYYMQELIRRGQAKQTSTLFGLTVAIGLLTLVGTLVTVCQVVHPH